MVSYWLIRRTRFPVERPRIATVAQRLESVSRNVSQNLKSFLNPLTHTPSPTAGRGHEVGLETRSKNPSLVFEPVISLVFEPVIANAAPAVRRGREVGLETRSKSSEESIMLRTRRSQTLFLPSVCRKLAPRRFGAACCQLLPSSGGQGIAAGAWPQRSFLRGAGSFTAMLFFVGTAAMIAGGCSKPQQPTGAAGTGTQTATQTSQEAAATAANTAVSVQVADEKRLAELIASKRGKVVLVDYWATWCPECIKLFPHTVKLYGELAGDGLDVISVSLDDPENQAAVIDFLRREGAAFDNLLSTYGGSNASIERFDIADGTLPHYKLYDRQGTLRHVFLSSEGSITAEELDRQIRQLLEETSPGEQQAPAR